MGGQGGMGMLGTQGKNTWDQDGKKPVKALSLKDHMLKKNH